MRSLPPQNKDGAGNNIFGILKVSTDSGNSWNTIVTASI